MHTYIHAHTQYLIMPYASLLLIHIRRLWAYHVDEHAKWNVSGARLEDAVLEHLLVLQRLQHDAITAASVGVFYDDEHPATHVLLTARRKRVGARQSGIDSRRGECVCGKRGHRVLGDKPLVAASRSDAELQVVKCRFMEAASVGVCGCKGALDTINRQGQNKGVKCSHPSR